MTGLNALIALLGYYFFIDLASRRLSAGVWSGEKVESGLRVFRFFRYIFTIISIGMGIYIIVNAAAAMSWPVWSWKIG